MPYLGNVPAENYAQVSYQDLTGGSGTSFTLDYPVGSAGEIEVFVNNVRQEPTVAYTVNGTALTMTGSVAATDDFYVVFQGKAEKSGTIPEKQSDGTYVFPDDVTVSGNITSTGVDVTGTITPSGGVYLGDTGSANLLDDYEEGTWTPASNHGTVTYGQAAYTKIGRLVTLNLNSLVLSDTTTAASITISGLPFSVSSLGSTGAVMMRYSGSTNAFTALVTGSNEILLYQSATTGSWYTKQYADFTSASNTIYLTVTYLTA